MEENKQKERQQNVGDTFKIVEPGVTEEEIKILYEIPGGGECSELGKLERAEVESNEPLITPDLTELKIQTNQEHFTSEKGW